MKIRGERILIFGDSLTHHGADADPPVWNVDQGAGRPSSAPGDLLASMFFDQGAAAVRTDAKVGRSAYSYFMGEEATTLAADVAWKPTKVIIFLGTNDTGYNLTIDGTFMAKIRDAFAKIPNVEIWSIGPPTFADPVMQTKAAMVYGMLRNVFGTNRIIDSRSLTTSENRTRDGVHFTQTGARDFALKLLGVFTQAPVYEVVKGLSAGTKFFLGMLATVGLGGLGYLTWRTVRTHKARPLFGATEEGSIDDVYLVGEDAIQANAIDEANRIAKEGHERWGRVFSPTKFWELKDKKSPYTYAKAEATIMNDLEAHHWTVKRGLKVPYATSPHGRLRLWFKPQTIWSTDIGRAVDARWVDRHDYKNARAIYYNLDTRKLPGPRFRLWLMQTYYPKTGDSLGRRGRRRQRPA